jgi:hypothetical protein
MPLQHVHSDVGAMRRETSREHIEGLICRLRLAFLGWRFEPRLSSDFPENGGTLQRFD